MNILRFLAGFLIILLTSCDPYTGSFVANSSNEKTAVNIKYNHNNQNIKNYVKIHNGFEKFVKFILDYQGFNGKLVAIDSSKYTATFELNQKDTLVIWGGIRQSNDFDEIDEVIVYPNKRKTTIKGEDIQDVFFEKNLGFYIYTVK
jgi:hypothetical protein